MVISVTKRQEINLYLPHLRPTRDYLSASTTAAGFGLLLLLFLLVGLIKHMNNRSLNQEIEQQQLVVAQQQQQLETLKQELPKSHAAQLDAEIVELRAQIARRKAIGQLIDGKSIGNTKGFSRQLQSLAENANAQLSLSRFQLLNGGAQVAIAGQTKSAEAVPYYIEALRKSDSFKHSAFGQLHIERQSDSRLLSFTLNQKGETE